MSHQALLISVSLLFASSLAFADDWSYGVKTGLNLANVTVHPSDPAVSYNARSCYGVGLTANRKINDVWDFRTDVLYLQKGTEASYHLSFFGYDFNGTDKVKLEYLAVTPMFACKFASWDEAKSSGIATSAFFEFGPEMAIIMSAKNDAGDYLYGMKNYDFDLNVGAGMMMPVGKGFLIPEARYSYGLTNINREGTGTVKTNGIQFIVGCLF